MQFSCHLFNIQSIKVIFFFSSFFFCSMHWCPSLLCLQHHPIPKSQQGLPMISIPESRSNKWSNRKSQWACRLTCASLLACEWGGGPVGKNSVVKKLQVSGGKQRKKERRGGETEREGGKRERERERGRWRDRKGEEGGGWEKASPPCSQSRLIEIEDDISEKCPLEHHPETAAVTGREQVQQDVRKSDHKNRQIVYLKLFTRRFMLPLIFPPQCLRAHVLIGEYCAPMEKINKEDTQEKWCLEKY